MKLVNEIKNKLFNDISIQLDDKKTKETILNILILPIIHHLKNEIINKYLNNDLEIDKQKNNLYDEFSNIIIENINDYFYKELYPFFLFLFIMVILLFILVLVVIVIILKLNIKKV
ncbi:uncharacterized protein METZ01_LOCUS43884 [marine metagenome]|uniref:Uncharacterized protein n=1 Tax=marine metagenome TaxID=408172 RepID=A0A381RGZ3_9ZZZZ